MHVTIALDSCFLRTDRIESVLVGMINIGWIDERTAFWFRRVVGVVTSDNVDVLCQDLRIDVTSTDHDGVAFLDELGSIRTEDVDQFDLF